MGAASTYRADDTQGVAFRDAPLSCWAGIQKTLSAAPFEKPTNTMVKLEIN
jgi:hypothetical protein